MDDDTRSELLALTADIITAHVENNTVAAASLPELISSVHAALAGLAAPAAAPTTVAEPAVPIRSSIKPDHLVCLEDGRKLKMLKRYLRMNYAMTPADYRAKWGLPRDYPMVAPAYAEQRRSLARQIGLGRKSAAPKAVSAKPAAAGTKPAAPRKRGRPRKVPGPAGA